VRLGVLACCGLPLAVLTVVVVATDSLWTRALARLRGPGIGARLARGTMWAMGSAVLVRGLGLVGTMWAARLLGADAFGQVGVVQQVAATMGTLAGLGVGTTASRFVAESCKTNPARASRFLAATAGWSWGSALLGGALLALLAPWLAEGPMASPGLEMPLLAAVPLLVFSLVAQAQTGGLAGFEAFRAMATSNLVGGILGIPLQIFGASRWGVPGFVLGLAAAELLRWILGRRALVRAMANHGIGWQMPHLTDLKQLLGFGLPSMLASIFVGPVLLASFAVVGQHQGGYAEVGLFQATQQYRNLLIFVSVQASSAIVPILAAAHGARDRAGLARNLRRAVYWSLASSAAAGLLLALLAPWAMGGFGGGFARHWTLLWWLAVLAPAQALNTVGASALSAVNRPWALLMSTVTFALAALLVVARLPTAQGLILSQGVGSCAALAVISWVLRHNWRH
jgi:O-antigen/teichoic acid export membrane protein